MPLLFVWKSIHIQPFLMLVKGMGMSVPQVSLFHHGIQMPTWVSSGLFNFEILLTQ